MGKSVVLIEPTRRLGGLTTGGLGQTDIGNKAAIGGIAREFYQRGSQALRRSGCLEMADARRISRQRADPHRGRGRRDVDVRAERGAEDLRTTGVREPESRWSTANGSTGRRCAEAGESGGSIRSGWNRGGHSAADVHRRHLRRRSDGRRRRDAMPSAARPTPSTAKRSTACRRPRRKLSPVRAGRRSLRRAGRSRQRPAAVHRSRRPGPGRGRAIGASRPTAFACA